MSAAWRHRGKVAPCQEGVCAGFGDLVEPMVGDHGCRFVWWVDPPYGITACSGEREEN